MLLWIYGNRISGGEEPNASRSFLPLSVPQEVIQQFDSLVLRLPVRLVRRLMDGGD